MLNETFLEMSYCKYNFGENKIEVLLWGGGGGLGLNFHTWAHWPKIRKSV